MRPKRYDKLLRITFPEAQKGDEPKKSVHQSDTQIIEGQKEQMKSQTFLGIDLLFRVMATPYYTFFYEGDLEKNCFSFQV